VLGSRGVSVSPTPPPLLSGTPDILKGAHMMTSEPSPCSTTRLEVSFKAPSRSLSEPSPRTDPLSPLDMSKMTSSSVEFPVEKELLGSDFVSHSQVKAKQILWKDNTTGGGMNTNSRPSSTSSVPARDGVPPEWDELAVDVKFSQSYVSLTLLRQEQETLSQELKRVPDTDKVPFPPCLSSVQKLVQAFISSPLLTSEERRCYHRQLSDWASVFSVTSQQKLDSDTFFKLTETKLTKHIL